MECPRCNNFTRWEHANIHYCYDCQKHFYYDDEGNVVEMED